MLVYIIVYVCVLCWYIVCFIAHLTSENLLCDYRNPALNFYYKDPDPNFNRGSVRGLVCNLFHVKDRKFAMALETAAGGRVSK